MANNLDIQTHSHFFALLLRLKRPFVSRSGLRFAGFHFTRLAKIRFPIRSVRHLNFFFYDFLKHVCHGQ